VSEFVDLPQRDEQDVIHRGWQILDGATRMGCSYHAFDRRAIQQSAGSFTWVITACPWWQTHNVSGQKAPVRVDRMPATNGVCVVLLCSTTPLGADA